MGGRPIIGIRKDIRTTTNKDIGDAVKVTLERDEDERSVDVPPDLAEALKGDAKKAFEGLSYTRQREYVEWIEEAKKPGTRARRIQGTIHRLVE